MNERDWEAACDPLELLNELFPMRGLDSTESQSRASKLYLIACARRIWPRLPWCGRQVIEFAERLVEKAILDKEVRAAVREIAEEFTHCRGDAEDLANLEKKLLAIAYPFGRRTEPDPPAPCEDWCSVAHLIYFPFAGTTPNYRRIAAKFHSIELLRDVFPNPYHAIGFAPEWLDRNVMGIARGIYTNKDYSPLPLLADALLDAGCDNDHILNHCRSAGPHVRGCWVIEGILNRPRLK
jgi:hypothetical protein